MTRRAQEILFYMHSVYPHQADSNKADFLDYNPSLGRLAKSGWKHGHLATLVGSMRVVMRRVREGHVCFRILTGYELMSVVGWHKSFYTDLSIEQNCTLSNLAGNAFSAFACMPLMVCAFAVLSKVAPPLCATPPVSVHESADTQDSCSSSLLDFA